MNEINAIQVLVSTALHPRKTRSEKKKKMFENSINTVHKYSSLRAWNRCLGPWNEQNENLRTFIWFKKKKKKPTIIPLGSRSTWASRVPYTRHNNMLVCEQSFLFNFVNDKTDEIFLGKLHKVVAGTYVTHACDTPVNGAHFYCSVVRRFTISVPNNNLTFVFSHLPRGFMTSREYTRTVQMLLFFADRI